MKKNKVNILKLGVFVTIGLFLFILGIYYLGKTQSLFQSNVMVYAEFNDVKGLQIGNEIRFLGINVGAVNDITILNDSLVRVELGIDQDIRHFIPTNSTVEVANEGIMGNRLVRVHAGTSEFPPIENGVFLQTAPSLTIEDVFDQIRRPMAYATEATENLVEITEKINRGEGDLGRFINDSSLKANFDALSANFLDMTAQVEDILRKINEGDNMISTLLNEDDLSGQVARIINNADSVTQTLKITSEELLLTTQKLNAGDGALPMMLNDSAFALEVDTTLYRVNEGIDAVIETANALQRSWILNLFNRNNRGNAVESLPD